MIYIIKHFDTELLKFSADENSSEPNIEVLWINEDKKHLLPMDMVVDSEGIYRWICHRIIPHNRAYSQTLLSKCGLSMNRPVKIIAESKGLSLNDSYWVVEEGFDGTFDKYNLYDNRFSQILALIAFTGNGNSFRNSLASSPEFTTNGMLPKCWRKNGGSIALYKGGTTGAYNAGNEPYSEFYAAQIAKIICTTAVDYKLSKWKGELCSVCELFTSKEYSFIPVGRIVTKGGFEAVREYYKSLGDEYVKALNEMIVFDAIICNTDRHFGNFGFLIDNVANEIVAPAPVFDHGNALFNFAGKSNLINDEALTAYADSLMPCVYDNFIAEAKAVMTPELQEKVRHLVNFKFKKNARYNLDNKRLKLIEKQVQKRAIALLS